MPQHAPSFDDLGFIGFWWWDFRAKRMEASAEMRRVLKFGSDDAGRSSLLEAYLRNVHPDDRAWLDRERPRSFGPSGRSALQYRLLDSAGRVRWVMCRAIYETDRDGGLLFGRGMLLDVTDLRADGNSCRSAPAPLVAPLQTAVDLALEAMEAATQVGDRNLIQRLESFLEAAGFLVGDQLSGRNGPH